MYYIHFTLYFSIFDTTGMSHLKILEHHAVWLEDLFDLSNNYDTYIQ